MDRVMNSFGRLKLFHRFAALIGVITLGFIVYGGWSFKTLNELKINGPLYQRIVQGKDLVADILPPPEYIIESYLVSFQLLASDDKAAQDKLIARFKALKTDYDKRHAFWAKQGLDADIADALLNQANTPALAFYDTAFKDFIPAIQSQNKEAAGAAMARMKVADENHLQAINRLVDLTNQRAAAIETESSSRISSQSVLLLAILVLSLGVGIAGAALITKSITGPLEEAVDVARIVASGDLRSQIDASFD